MPIVAAAGFKGDISNADTLRTEHIQIALPRKVLRKGIIFSTHRKDGTTAKVLLHLILFHLKSLQFFEYDSTWSALQVKKNIAIFSIAKKL